MFGYLHTVVGEGLDDVVESPCRLAEKLHFISLEQDVTHCGAGEKEREVPG